MSLRLLPRVAATWEIAEVPAPVGAIFIAADRDGVRLVRMREAGEPAGPLLEAAMANPMGEGKPCRPERVRCQDATLLAELRPVLEAAGVRWTRVDKLEMLDAVIEALANEDGVPVLAPGITTDFGAWRQTLDALLSAAPWTVLDDEIRFTFAGGGLDGAVGVLLGNSGEIFGFSLYASAEDLERFIASAETEMLPDCTASVLNYESEEDLTEEEVETCERLGLALAEGAWPRVFGLEPGTAAPLDEAAQRRLRLAIEGVIAVSTGKLRSIARGDEVSVRIRRAEGVVEVTAARTRT